MEPAATTLNAPPTASASLAFRRARRRQLREKLIEWVVSAIGLSGIALVVLIFIFVGKEAVPLFTEPEMREEASVEKMFTPQETRKNKPKAFIWQPVSKVPKVSMLPLFLGTLKVTFVSMLFAVPLGILAALFASEFASRRVREVVKPAIELLAGIPSVVLGFFALVVLATWVQDTLGLSGRLNAVVAGLALAIAIVPIIFTVAEDALTAVPRSYREASLALGATKWETAWKVVLPAAMPGVLAACVLGFGRAIGETMIVLMASGNAATFNWNIGESVRTLSATIAAEMGEVMVGSTHYSLLFFIGVELFIFTFVLNLIAAAWVRREVKRLGGRVS